MSAVLQWPAAWASAVEEYMFSPQRWVQPATLSLWCGPEQVEAGRWSRQTRPADLWDPQPQDWSPSSIRHMVDRLCPLGSVDLDLLWGSWRNRLALLSRAEWMQLGLCLAVLPFSGHLQRSMDGHLRRALRQGLDERVVQALDAESSARQLLRFLGGPGAWRNPQALACGGARAAIEQVCRWPDPIRRRSLLRFGPEDLSTPPSVSGLDAHWLELSCRLMWPEHPWLWC